MFRFGVRSLLFAILLVAVSYPIIKNQIDARPINYVPYDKMNLQASLDRGDCVLVTVYATWTPNTIDLLQQMSPEVGRQLRQRGIVMMHADYTNGAGDVGELMQNLNFKAVPALALFDPNNPSSPQVVDNSVNEAELLTLIRARHGKSSQNQAVNPSRS